MRLGLLSLILTLEVWAQTATRSPGLANILNFEAEQKGQWPAGWGGGPAGTAFVDDKIVHAGRASARLERVAGSPGQFSTITIGFPVDFAGSSIQLKGFLRLEDVSGTVGLWLREDGDAGAVAFDNMQNRQLKGTLDWVEYTVNLPLEKEAKQLFFGFLMSGTGRAWVDDMQLLVDGKPVWEAPEAVRPKTVLDSDHEFDTGSGIVLKELSSVQVGNLALLGKVWGYVKYHHPQVTSGKRHLDYDLFRVLPAIVAAPDRTSAQAALAKWVDDIGPAGPCDRCAQLAEKDVHLRPDLDWISDTALLGAKLAVSLQAVHSRRTAGQQCYVSQMPGVLNPKFEHESDYKNVKIPDAGFQLLALYRFWNIIAYWFPDRDVIGENWDKVLAESIPKIALAGTQDFYQLEMMALIARVHDTHANLWSSLSIRPPAGNCRIPVEVRFIENRPLVTGYLNESAREGSLKKGDVVTSIDGVAVTSLLERWLPYYAASNRVTQLRDVARSMLNGACGKAVVSVEREGKVVDVAADRVPSAGLTIASTHDLRGDTFRKLSPEVAYLKLSSVKLPEAARYIDDAAGSKGLIIDIRNYPSAFMVFALGSRLVASETEFVRFTFGDLSNPGAFHWGQPLTLKPETPHHTGKVVILVDEVSQSQAEYTTMAFRIAPGAKVVGSTTAGADGNVSTIPLPGGLSSMISGIGVFYPDKRPTQRVGIIPDVEVRPTISGIRAGRDEVLETAVRQILGPDVPAEQIEKIAKP